MEAAALVGACGAGALAMGGLTQWRERAAEGGADDEACARHGGSAPTRTGELPAIRIGCSVDRRPSKRSYVAFDGEALLVGPTARNLEAILAIGGANVDTSGRNLSITGWRSLSDRIVELSFDSSAEATAWGETLRAAAVAMKPPPSRIRELREQVAEQTSTIGDLKAALQKAGVDAAAIPATKAKATKSIEPAAREEKKRDMAAELSMAMAAGSGALNNILLLTDSYKVTHHLQYPPGTETIYSYFECRGGAYEEVCFFGLQYYLKKYLAGPVVTLGKIAEAERYFTAHFSNPVWGYNENLFNRSAWEHIVKVHGGHLPISIKAIPEGTVVPFKNVLFTMENTDPQCYWLTNYLETLLVQIWYPTTVCTQSREQKKIIMRHLRETGCGDVIDNGLHLFKLHDFGFRGVSSVESAATGGVAHLVNFRGSDTMVALSLAREYYAEDCAGFSIPASEHSTMTSWGREREVDAMRNMLEMYPKGLMACVSDSYDIFKACEQYWGTELKDLVQKRDGVVVVRPDSGRLPDIVLQVLEKLEKKFGHTRTSTGHKLLPSCIRVIQGDGIDIRSLDTILTAMQEGGWAADNLAFGSGGALLQKLHRDTQKCAFKCSYALVNGQGMDVVKDPITDPGKRSKKGRLSLELRGGKFVTVAEGRGDPDMDCLVEVFRDGRLFIDDPLQAVRRRAEGECVAPEPAAGASVAGGVGGATSFGRMLSSTLANIAEGRGSSSAEVLTNLQRRCVELEGELKKKDAALADMAVSLEATWARARSTAAESERHSANGASVTGEDRDAQPAAGFNGASAAEDDGRSCEEDGEVDAEEEKFAQESEDVIRLRAEAALTKHRLKHLAHITDPAQLRAAQASDPMRFDAAPRGPPVAPPAPSPASPPASSAPASSGRATPARASPEEAPSPQAAGGSAQFHGELAQASASAAAAAAAAARAEAFEAEAVELRRAGEAKDVEIEALRREVSELEALRSEAQDGAARAAASALASEEHVARAARLEEELAQARAMAGDAAAVASAEAAEQRAAAEARDAEIAGLRQQLAEAPRDLAKDAVSPESAGLLSRATDAEARVNRLEAELAQARVVAAGATAGAEATAGKVKRLEAEVAEAAAMRTEGEAKDLEIAALRREISELEGLRQEGQDEREVVSPGGGGARAKELEEELAQALAAVEQAEASVARAREAEALAEGARASAGAQAAEVEILRKEIAELEVLLQGAQDLERRCQEAESSVEAAEQRTEALVGERDREIEAVRAEAQLLEASCREAQASAAMCAQQLATERASAKAELEARAALKDAEIQKLLQEVAQLKQEAKVASHQLLMEKDEQFQALQQEVQDAKAEARAQEQRLVEGFDAEKQTLLSQAKMAEQSAEEARAAASEASASAQSLEAHVAQLLQDLGHARAEAASSKASDEIARLRAELEASRAAEARVTELEREVQKAKADAIAALASPRSVTSPPAASDGSLIASEDFSPSQRWSSKESRERRPMSQQEVQVLQHRLAAAELKRKEAEQQLAAARAAAAQAASLTDTEDSGRLMRLEADREKLREQLAEERGKFEADLTAMRALYHESEKALQRLRVGHGEVAGAARILVAGEEAMSQATTLRTEVPADRSPPVPPQEPTAQEPATTSGALPPPSAGASTGSAPGVAPGPQRYIRRSAAETSPAHVRMGPASPTNSASMPIRPMPSGSGARPLGAFPAEPPAPVGTGGSTAPLMMTTSSLQNRPMVTFAQPFYQAGSFVAPPPGSHGPRPAGPGLISVAFGASPLRPRSATIPSAEAMVANAQATAAPGVRPVGSAPMMMSTSRAMPRPAKPMGEMPFMAPAPTTVFRSVSPMQQPVRSRPTSSR